MTRRIDPIWVILAIAATALGIWLGVTAVDVSPIFSQAPLARGGPGR